MGRKTLGKYGGNHYGRGLGNSRKRRQKQKGGNNNKVISHFNGGLANRIIQIYAGLGYAEKWESEYYLSDKRMGYADHVSNEESINNLKTLFPNIKMLDDSESIEGWKKIDEGEHFKYKDIENPNTNVILEGYFQSTKYFPQNLPLLEIPEPSNNLFDSLNKDNIYFLHIRLGDYVNTGFEIDLKKYYTNCINKIKEINPNAEFFILSNELEKAKAYIQDNVPILNNLTIHYDTSTKRLDTLYYMSQSKGGICSNSTFSWVGAFSIKNKNKDLIFIPKPWFNYVPDDAEIYPDWATIVDTRILSGGSKKKSRKTRKKKHTKKQKGGAYKIFIIHYLPLTDRKLYILEQLKKYNLEAEFVNMYENTSITDNNYKKYNRKLKVPFIDLNKKNIYCYNEILNKYDYALILEDDFILDDNFNNQLDMFMKELPNDWDLFFIGSCLNIHIKNSNIIDNKHVYKRNSSMPATRCSHAYMVSKNGAKKLLDKINDSNYIITWPIDFLLNELITLLNLNVYWSEPSIVSQGSESSKYNSSLEKHRQKGGAYKDDIFLDDELNCKYLSMYGIMKASKDIKNLHCINFNDELNSFVIPSDPFVLFTYSDSTVPDDNMEKSTEILNSPNLLHWYAQNLVKHDNPKLTIIPIGIDYHTIAEHKSGYEWWGPKETPVQQEKLLLELNQIAKPLNERGKKLYCNFYNTIRGKYGAQDRKEALEQISNNLIYIEKNNIPRADSWKNMSETAFVLSPHGNGLDCHRTWEALALGCIPIVKKSSIDPLYNNLPVLIVDNWSDINQELLDKTINDFTNKTFNLDTITYKYWIDTIKNSFTQTGGTQEKIDIIIAYHPKDKKVLPYSIEGTKNIKNRNNIYIISSEDPKIEGTIYIDENMFPFKKDNIKEYFGEKNSSRAGWYFKQLMNLYAHRVITNITDKFLLLDCDTLFINEVSMIDEEGRCLYSTGSENHKPYFDHMKKLIPGLDRQIPEKSGIVHHLMVEKKYLDEIIQKVEEIHKKFFWKVMMELIDKNEIHSSGFAEYEIYFNYMLKYHHDKIKLRNLRWGNYNELPDNKNVNTIKELINKYKDKYDFISLHSWQINDNTFKNNSDRNTNISIPFIFVHIGETKFPEYINISFKQVKKWNPNSTLYLICSKTHETKIDKNLVNFVDINEVSKSEKHKRFNSNSKLNSNFRNGFWKFTTQRLFMVEDFCKKNNIKEFFHLENDNMIYFNIEEIVTNLRKLVNGVASPRLNNDEITFGLLYCNNLEILNKLNEYILANNSNNNYNANEMKLGSRFFKENPTTTYYLPSIPLIKDISEEEKKFYSNDLDKFKGVFDPAQYGQWLGGIDPDNGNSKALSYSNPNTFIQPNLFEYKLIKESNNLSRYHIYYKDKNIDLPIYLLHVHSKKLDNFLR